ncbi:MAG: response regulator [Candidatus Electrothrix communis]|nr:response regulator [Desulfobulbus sp. US4]WLE97620.1 MAG: response regulator [Candidatus Electrothrix communis]
MKHVVIVDDEPDLLLSIRAGFERNDRFQLMTAENGMEALDILDNNIVDLVVTDLRMPKMDGIELLAAMSQSFPEIPSIVMTAFGTSGLEQQLIKAGTLNLLEKPLDIDTLEQAINKALDFYQNSVGGPNLDIFLQLVAMEKKTAHLKVFDFDNRHGSFFFRKGYLIDAEQGDLTGDEAVLEMLEWHGIRLSMKEFCPSALPSDKKSQLTPLLFGMPYHKEQTGDVNPLDKIRDEFNRLQKKNEQNHIRN